MILIKRYPNRKLYNTEAKQYVTLEGIAELIRQGQEVQITDHQTGEDLTAVTLTQIIFEQEKKEGGFLPRAVLTSLIQSGGHTLTELKRSLASQMGLFQHVNSEIERRIQTLIRDGILDRAEGEQLQARLISADQAAREAAFPTDEEIEQLLIRRGVPSQEDLKNLNEKLDELVVKLENVEITRE
ncbi:MAG: polyhydroxyalkanoate synthesis regulator DNA-binding domain-containing protein [Chloroflexota bacterium]|jgi:polyhydroxyalkanoate synthesis repressor PhaR